MMNSGIQYKSGDVFLASVQFTDTFEIKKRPVVVLFSEFDNVVVAGITSNLSMKGVLVDIVDGLKKPSVIKLNYIFTLSSSLLKKCLCSLSKLKQQEIYFALLDKLHFLS